jgi:hypothetical protein
MNHVMAGQSSVELWIVKGFRGTSYCIKIISQRTLYLVQNISGGS